MMPSKALNSNVVTSIADTDLVTIPSPQGGLQNITFANLMKAVRERVQIGGRNLLKNSESINLTHASWGVAIIGGLSEPLEVGGTYIFSCGSKSDSVQPKIYLTEEAQTSMTAQSPEMDKPFVASAPSRFLWVWIHGNPNGAVSGFVKKAKLERGNIATDWSPAPEDIASGAWGGNWLLRNQLQFSRERRCA